MQAGASGLPIRGRNAGGGPPPVSPQRPAERAGGRFAERAGRRFSSLRLSVFLRRQAQRYHYARNRQPHYEQPNRIHFTLRIHAPGWWLRGVGFGVEMLAACRGMHALWMYRSTIGCVSYHDIRWRVMPARRAPASAAPGRAAGLRRRAVENRPRRPYNRRIPQTF
jgi:hypothetical protein